MKENEIKSLINDLQDSENQLVKMENQIQMNPEFKKFLDLQKAVNAKADEVWSKVQTAMEDGNIKTLKGDFGTISLAERLNWSTDDSLPEEFYKKAVDTKRISDWYRLMGDAPQGAKMSTTRYLIKKLKGNENE